MREQAYCGFMEKWRFRKIGIHFALCLFIITSIFLGLSVEGLAQTKELEIEKAEKEEVVKKICEILEKNYVYPETARKMSNDITQKLENGAYDAIHSPRGFADRLQQDLRIISRDLHIRVFYDPEGVDRLRRRKKNIDDPELIKRMLRAQRRVNFGFREVKILSGNIGYLDLRQFASTKYAGETAVAAMNFLANCDALIVDLRNNEGGSWETIQLLTSYFYDKDPIHLNTFYWRPSDKTVQTWTLPYVPGKKIPEVDIYVLTSRRTVSAAEEFSYNLKNLKRATLVGETTRGGAHPGGPVVINDNFYIFVPQGKAINPITKTNWEGVGVKPDIEVPQADALKTAHLKALEKLSAYTTDEQDKFMYDWHIESLKAELNPVEVDPGILQSYIGKYGPRTITFESGILYYQREGRPKYKMIPLSEDLFMFKEIDYFRLKIIKENGEIKGVMGVYNNGTTDMSLKDK
ncbi:MAG: S41 family peptidase [Candidatus Aminicenantaceae bacterium]